MVVVPLKLTFRKDFTGSKCLNSQSDTLYSQEEMKPALTTQVLQGEMPPELNPFIMYYQMAKDLINVMYKKLSQPQLEYDSEDDVFGEDDFNNKENMYSSSPRSRGY